MEKRTITIVTLHDNTLKDMMKQCYELGIIKEFCVEGRTIAQLTYLPVTDSSLIVTSSASLVSDIKSFCVHDIPIIVAKRSINYANLREVLELPRGAKVLLVNDSKERAMLTIELLQQAGIDLDFFPFYPEQEVYPKEISIAITPGEANLVPSSIAKVIDIGSRIIDIATWIEIAAHFAYEQPNLCNLAEKYICSVVDITKQLSREIQTTYLLHKQLEGIINRIEDGVLVVDEQDVVSIINDKALKTFKLDSSAIIGKPIAQNFNESFYKLIFQMPFEQEEVLNWDGQSFFFRKSHIVLEGKNYGFLIVFRRASEINNLEHEYRRKQMSKGLLSKYTFHDLLGVSSSFRQVCGTAMKMAKGNSTILLLGETGTGKELLAQAIHSVSSRAKEPFVGVNFAAISESLLEGELFGYEEGAFTGAKKGGHIGLFEQAHKGTIFLDEIGDASPAIQNRLLRVLQEKEIMRVGGKRIIPVDIRVIAATNRDLENLIHEGVFRADLYYRLHVLPIHVPPLRERKEDIPVLVQNFIVKFCKELKRPVFRLSATAFQCLVNYDWPGNIRELENAIQYLAYVAEAEVGPEQLPLHAVSNFDSESERLKTQWENVYQAYQAKGFLNEIKMILQLIGKAERAVGRNYVLERLLQQGIFLTDQQLRYRMQMLKNDCLLEVGRGRQGSSLTSQGLDFLQYLLR